MPAPTSDTPISTFFELSTPDLLARYRLGVENFEKRLFTCTDEQLDMAFLPDAGVGRWPIRVLLGHLADAELAFVHRMRRAVAEDNPLLAAWDENAFIDAGLYGPTPAVGGAGGGGEGPKVSQIAGYVAVLHTLRRWHADWLATLKPEQFARTALHPERGRQSVRDILAYATWHVEHHAWFLKLKLDRLGK